MWKVTYGKIDCVCEQVVASCFLVTVIINVAVMPEEPGSLCFRLLSKEFSVEYVVESDDVY